VQKAVKGSVRSDGVEGARVGADGQHYHFFIETPEANLLEGVKWLQKAGEAG
jgi:hypothetical protein